MTNTPPLCRRCGRCCLAGGPSLHLRDIPLIEDGTLRRDHLVTLRRGEPVHENVAGGLAVLEAEMIKIGWTDENFACRFYDRDEAACLIHERRPAQCRALFCEDTSALRALYATERLTRAELVDRRGGLWELIAFHDRFFPAGEAAALARDAARGAERAREALLELVRAEESFRSDFLEKTGADPAELDFLFGRSLAAVCAPLGVAFRG